jgi:hypothetical protein
MNDEQVLTQVLEDKKASEQFQRPYFDMFREFYKLYRSYIDPDKHRLYRSNLFIPKTFEVIETVTPKIVSAIFSNRPYVTTVALGSSRWNVPREIRAGKMNNLLDYQFQQKIHIVPIGIDLIKTALIYGTCITKETWKFRKKQVVDRRPVTMLGIPIPNQFKDVLVERVVDDDPRVELVPLLDFFFDPAAHTIEGSRYCIHRYWEDLHELKVKAKEGAGYKNIDKLADTEDPHAHETTSDMLDSIGMSTGTNRRKGIEILEYWTDDWVVRVANQSVVIYNQETPFYHRSKPFSRTVDASVPGEFYGIGEIEPIIGLQEELNVTRNQRIDNVALVMNKMYKVMRGANIDPKQLISRPAGFIEVDTMDDVEEMKFDDVTSSSYNEEGVIKDDIDKTLGVSDSARGSDPKRRETATTMSILANAASERFRLKVLMIEKTGIEEMTRHIIRMNQQFIDREREIMILGNDDQTETVTVSPEEILGEYDIAAIGSASNPSASKEVQQSQLIQLLNVVQNNPYVNQMEFLTRLFEAFEMKNIPALLQEPQPQVDPATGMPLQQPPMPGVMPVG